ncbi:polysaccharide biosynthesis protein [Arenimonas sp.]|uniref:polysaccharide biosynthesis protein n=1 Tax=Arenimonas sp. TaxID=1872635 RepID=UPI0039E47437
MNSLRLSLPRMLVAFHDIAMVAATWLLLRWLAGLAGAPPAAALQQELLLACLVQAAVFWRVGLYRGLWRFASMPDLMNIASAALIGLLLIIPGLLLFGLLPDVPRRVLAPYPFLLILLLGSPRLLYRFGKDYSLSARHAQDAPRILVLGAGQAGELLLRHLRSHGAYQAVGLLDDRPGLKGAEVQGVPVLGSMDDLATVAKATAPNLLVIAMPSADAAQMQRVVSLCEDTGLPFRTVSRLADAIDWQADEIELREVAIEQLLGREPVKFDWELLRDNIGGRSVLITGAGGSIGSELARQCARAGVARLLLLERAELSLDLIASEIGRRFPELELQPILADCADTMAYREALASIDFVFHAAACKQVPMLEGQPREALRNNVLASAAVAAACREAGTADFVLISTDKAIEPVSVLGASKRWAEIVCQAVLAGSRTRLAIVRFGNVLDSAGSVVPLFRQQIAAGGPVTVTHPDVSRYFMTIPEACQLILQSATIASQPASVLALDMGRPVAIRELAEQMIRLAGKQPGRDVRIDYIGLRPGEKLHEVVFHPDERYQRTANPRVLRAEPRPVDAPAALRGLQRLRELLAAPQPDTECLAILSETVRDYRTSADKIVSLSARRKNRQQI